MRSSWRRDGRLYLDFLRSAEREAENCGRQRGTMREARMTAMIETTPNNAITATREMCRENEKECAERVACTQSRRAMGEEGWGTEDRRGCAGPAAEASRGRFALRGAREAGAEWRGRRPLQGVASDAVNPEQGA